MHDRKHVLLMPVFLSLASESAVCYRFATSSRQTLQIDKFASMMHGLAPSFTLRGRSLVAITLKGWPFYDCKLLQRLHSKLWVLQGPGEMVITFPRAYHAGFNTGLNCAEAVNFATADWLRFGEQSLERFKMFHRQPVFCHSRILLQVAIYWPHPRVNTAWPSCMLGLFHLFSGILPRLLPLCTVFHLLDPLAWILYRRDDIFLLILCTQNVCIQLFILFWLIAINALYLQSTTSNGLSQGLGDPESRTDSDGWDQTLFSLEQEMPCQFCQQC